MIKCSRLQVVASSGRENLINLCRRGEVTYSWHPKTPSDSGSDIKQAFPIIYEGPVKWTYLMFSRRQSGRYISQPRGSGHVGGWLTDRRLQLEGRRTSCGLINHRPVHLLSPPERKTSINYPANETNPFGWWSVTSSRHGDGWRSRCHLVPVTKQYLSKTQSEGPVGGPDGLKRRPPAPRETPHVSCMSILM